MIEQPQKKRAGRPRGTRASLRRPIVPIDKTALSPAMLDLPNDRWRAAVTARFMVKTNTEAVRLAGFGNSATTPHNMARMAHAVFHDPRTLRALKELGEKHLVNGIPDAIAVIDEIMADVEHKDRLKAAQVRLDRAYPLQTQHLAVVEHRHTNTIDEKALTETLSTIALRFGLDRQKVLARPAVIDAEYEEAS
jgi:hypothetical protein